MERYRNVNATAASAAESDGQVSTAAMQNEASSASPTTTKPMDLSKLLRRHLLSALPSPPLHAHAVGATAEPRVSTSPLPTSRTTAAAATINATVAKAEAAIAAAAAKHQHQRRQQQQDSTRHHCQVYREHCSIGWSPEAFYQVVADVDHYASFLPWCLSSEVLSAHRVQLPSSESETHHPRHATPPDSIAAAPPPLVDAMEMSATLTIGFSFLREQYTSRVLLYPNYKIVAVLSDGEEDCCHDSSSSSSSNSSSRRGGGSGVAATSSGASRAEGGGVLGFFRKAAKKSILKYLRCEWEFHPIAGQPDAVEVFFSVSFEFKNPLHHSFIMSNVVGLMTRSFERRCEALYGPPSSAKVALPVATTAA